ncbi:MAG: class I SAM-dependent methyltransferase [Gemmatimonadales bacterium]
MSGFQDHFSERAAGYATYRPTYPDDLFEWLASRAPSRRLAWDCATGSGQAVAGLARRFERVVATDASADQLKNARPFPNVEYRVARAEASELEAGSVDLITVAQALHWFDHGTFFAEVGRVARPGAIVAAWMYNLMQVSPEFDQILARFYSETVGPFWPGERVYVDQGYRTVSIPFRELAPPPFEMEADWSFDHLLGYLRTWSAVARYAKARGDDPVALVAPELARHWGAPDLVRRVCWPIALRVAVVEPPETATPTPS